MMNSKILDNIQLRSSIYKKIRSFFEFNKVMEVETPLMCENTVTDPFIDSVKVNINGADYFLQSSPEMEMKKMILSGMGDVFQICKAFRADDFGQYHQPEFTMLEWYRLEQDYLQLMREVVSLLVTIMGPMKVEYVSYAALFKSKLGICPFEATISDMASIACKHNLNLGKSSATFSLSDWQNCLFSLCIEPMLVDIPCLIVYDFPIGISSLAKADPENKRIAQRFELYLNGIECGNGYSELEDKSDYLARFKVHNAHRQQNGLNPMQPDATFIKMLDQSAPKCAGVSLGLDRILMIISKSKSIEEIIPRFVHDELDGSPKLVVGAS